MTTTDHKPSAEVVKEVRQAFQKHLGDLLAKREELETLRDKLVTLAGRYRAELDNIPSEIERLTSEIQDRHANGEESPTRSRALRDLKQRKAELEEWLLDVEKRAADTLLTLKGIGHQLSEKMDAALEDARAKSRARMAKGFDLMCKAFFKWGAAVGQVAEENRCRLGRYARFLRPYAPIVQGPLELVYVKGGAQITLAGGNAAWPHTIPA